MTIILAFVILFFLFGGGYYGWYRGRPTVVGAPASSYGYAPGLGGILVTIVVLYVILHILLRIV